MKHFGNDGRLPTAGGSFSGDSDDISEGATQLFLTASERTKLAGIAASAEVNVNADWNAVAGDALIQNKPTLGTAAAQATGAFEAAGGIATHAALTQTHGISAFGATLVDDADAAAARTTLNLGAIATQSPSGAPDGTKFLRDDYSWQAAAGGSGLTEAQVRARAFLRC